MGQELLTTVDEDISHMTLVPQTGGIFEVFANGDRVWSRSDEGRFPELKELKQRVRDRIAPGKQLGHSDSEHRSP